MPRLVNPKPPNATLVKADGTTTSIRPKNGTDFQLKELYDLLGCKLIEIARSQSVAQIGRANKDYILIIDEEGKFSNKRVNVLATEWYSNTFDIIVGDVILCHKDMLK